MMKIRIYERGSILISYGDRSKLSYIVLTGCVNLYDKDENDNGAMIYPSKFINKNLKDEKIPSILSDDEKSYDSNDLEEFIADRATNKIWKMQIRKIKSV